MLSNKKKWLKSNNNNKINFKSTNLKKIWDKRKKQNQTMYWVNPLIISFTPKTNIYSFIRIIANIWKENFNS